MDCRCAWLSLDQYDNVSYLLAAIRKINKKFGTMIEDLMAAPKFPGVETVSLYMIKELEQVQEPFILILDDYHMIHNEYINGLIQKLLDFISLRLIIITRQDPPLSFSRWRVEDRITELNAADLKFTNTEIREFFNRYFNIEINDDMLQIIKKQMEGWVAGMQLAGLSLKHMETTQRLPYVIFVRHQNTLDKEDSPSA